MSTTFGFHCGKTLIKENYSLDFSCSESPVLVPPVAQASDVSEPKTRTAYRHMASLDLSLLDLLSRIFIKKGFFHDFLKLCINQDFVIDKKKLVIINSRVDSPSF